MKALLPLFPTLAAATDFLLPLYQYPAGNGAAWQPIAQALAANPALTAKIVINPSNGPGSGPGVGINDTQYVAGTQMLAAASPGVELLGYVHTSTNGGQTRCNMDWETVKGMIQTWSTWVPAGVPITGIFIDESPFNTDNDCVAYMRNLTTFIKTDPSLAFAKRRVVFNPGGIGTLQPYYDMQPDLIVALETCFTVPERATNPDYDGCDPSKGSWERYDHDGVGSSWDNVVLPSVGQANAARTAVLVHGFHDYNGASANLSATAEVLGELVRGVVQRGVGATFFNTAGYGAFDDGPASTGEVVRLINAANGN